MKKKLFSVAALAMAFAMAVTGCSSSEGETTTGEETTDGETAEDDNEGSFRSPPGGRGV